MALTLNDSLALFAAMAVLSALPSVSTLTIASRSAASGLASGAAVAAGIVTGDLFFILVAMLGLAALAETFGALFAVVRALGGFYLLWLGIGIWRSALPREEPVPEAAQALTATKTCSDTPTSVCAQTGTGTSGGPPNPAKPRSSKSYSSDFLAGLLITMGDQKAILFYLGFLPAFVDLSAVTAADLVRVVVIAVAAVGSVKLAYAWLAARAGHLSLLRTPMLNRLIAMVLVVIGATLLGRALFMR